MVGDVVAVYDQVTSTEDVLGYRRARGLLLTRVTWNETAESAVCDVHEPGAVDPALGQPSPLVRRPEERPRDFERVTLADGSSPSPSSSASARIQPG